MHHIEFNTQAFYVFTAEASRQARTVQGGTSEAAAAAANNESDETIERKRPRADVRLVFAILFTLVFPGRPMRVTLHWMYDVYAEGQGTHMELRDLWKVLEVRKRLSIDFLKHLRV
jgi:hypothetical protein